MKYAIFLLTTLAMADTAPIPDEALRIAALRAIFPGMPIELIPGKRVNDSWPEKPPKPTELDAPDALAGENVYRVTGAATNAAEKTASGQLVTGKPSNTRLVRFQIFRWPDSTGIVAVLQYNFEGAVPSMSCPSIGLLVHLANIERSLEVRDRYLLEPMFHYSLKTVRMLNLMGGDADDLIIESDFGGSEVWGTNFLVFHPGAKLRPIFETTSQLSNKTDNLFTESLDVPETIQREGARFCFTKTTIIENGILFDPARVTRPCYQPADNLAKESEERNKLLAPLK